MIRSSSASPLLVIISSYLCWSASSLVSSSNCAMPRIAFIGVRISCDMLERNSDLARDASSADSRAATSSRAVSRNSAVRMLTSFSIFALTLSSRARSTAIAHLVEALHDRNNQKEICKDDPSDVLSPSPRLYRRRPIHRYREIAAPNDMVCGRDNRGGYQHMPIAIERQEGKRPEVVDCFLIRPPLRCITRPDVICAIAMTWRVRVRPGITAFLRAALSRSPDREISQHTRGCAFGFVHPPSGWREEQCGDDSEPLKHEQPGK